MDKPRIFLVRPNYRSHLITPPLGLGYLSSYLELKGYKAKIIDGLNLSYSIEQIVNQCQGAELVGIHCLSAYFLEAITLSQQLKKKGIRVAIGGPHATALPELTLSESQADFVIAGEGETPLLELVKSLENNNSLQGIPGILTHNTQYMVRAPLIQELDSLPFPDWQQIDPRIYKKAPHGGLIKSFPVAPIISSRGCSFECTFCASPYLWGKTIRLRSPENVIEEIEYLTKAFGVKEIHFEDDNLTLNKTHIENICKLILKRKIKINWATPNGIRVDTLDFELLKLMKESGCYFLAFGIESGNQAILDRAKKRTDLKSVEKVTALAKKIGMITQGFFIFGLPGETERTIAETIRYAKKLRLDKAQFLILDLLPGSKLWDELSNKQCTDWRYRSFQEAAWVPEGLTKEKLNALPGYALRSFFLRPHQIYFLLRYFKFSQFPFIIKRMMDFAIIPSLKYRKKES